MAGSPFPGRFVTFLRGAYLLPRPLAGGTQQVRNLSSESGGIEFGSQERESKELSSDKENPLGFNDQFNEVVREVADIFRTSPRWEETLLSRFGSFDFADPRFFDEILKHQNNVFFTMMVFHWLWSRHGFVPDQAACRKLVASLFDAKVYGAAKWFLEVSGFRPGPDVLERLVRGLCQGRMMQDAFDVFLMFTEAGACPPIATWNLVFSLCVEVGRTDLLWKFYLHMIQCGAVAGMDSESVKHLIQGCCIDGQEIKGYEELKQALEFGVVPEKVTFDALIFAFSKKGDFSTASEILHLMIAMNVAPDCYTYQHIINGLWKRKHPFEAMRIFNDVRNRGYKPNRIVYNTMIHGLAEFGWFDKARKLWLEMVHKGIEPDGYTYNSLAYGYFKNRDWESGMNMFREMVDRGFGGTTIAYNMVISGLCSCRQHNKAFQLFDEMKEKGITCDVVPYNFLIASFSRAGKMDASKKLLKELVAEGIQPTISTYRPIINLLCKKSKVQSAKKMWNEMLNRGLEPTACDYDLFISALCKKGHASDGLEWLVAMLNRKLKPENTTFQRLLRCLVSDNMLDEAQKVLKYMYMARYTLGEGMRNYLATKLR